MENQVAAHKKTIEELQSDLQKLSELRSKEQEEHKAELAITREAVKNAEEYCAGRFESFSEMLYSKMLLLALFFWAIAILLLILGSYSFVIFTAYSTNPDAEQAHMAKYAEFMKKYDYTPKTT